MIKFFLNMYVIDITEGGGYMGKWSTARNSSFDNERTVWTFVRFLAPAITREGSKGYTGRTRELSGVFS